MLTKEEVIQAIGAHIWWKHEFATAINERRYWLHPDTVANDRECEFGRWLYGLSPDDQNSGHFRLVQSLHATFHEEAAHVMRLALAGDAAGAQTAIAIGLYPNISTALLIAMGEWAEALGSSSHAAAQIQKPQPNRADPDRSQPGANA
jgi:hypothetical protein